MKNVYDFLRALSSHVKSNGKYSQIIDRVK